MNRVIATILALFLCAGCAHGPVRNEDEGAGHVSGVRQDLDGIKELAIKELATICVRQGKIFLYASQYTDSPVVEKADVRFAAQFKTAPVYSGFREAAVFNAYMLEYARGQLKRGLCPEHTGVPVTLKVVRGKKTALKDVKSAVTEKIFVCPCDSREFILCGMDGVMKARE